MSQELPTGTVTFLFTDIEDSTRLLQRVGPRYREVLERHGQLIRDALANHHGIEVNTEGDSFFVVFTSAREAVLAARTAQRSLFHGSWPEDDTLRVRMGLHTGEGVRGGDNYVGLDVHRAARIGSAAHGGQVLISASTRALVDGSLPEDMSLLDMGEHRLKGLDRPERLFQVVAPELPAQFPPLRTEDARPNNLPIQATGFVGRERHLKAVKELLESGRLVTLTGPGGTGKTRLALQVASEALEDFPGGVFLARLEGLRDPELVTTTVARALGVVERGERPVVQSLRDYLANRRVLLILDNFEHLSEATPQVADLLSRAPKLKILATSRSPLGLHGEREYPLAPMEIPDLGVAADLQAMMENEAVDLFVRRVREVRPDFELTAGNASAVAGIVRKLDGLPLALELAAARLKLFSPEELLARLSDRLTLLTSRASDAPARHRTLRDAIAWSHDLLSEEEKAVFRRLGAFSASFNLEAAEAIAGASPVTDVVQAVSSLLDRSLLHRRVELQGQTRFQMLETIHAFALSELSGSREEDRVREAHSAYFLDRAERAQPELTRARQRAWLERLELDHDDFRAVLAQSLERGNGDVGLRLGRALWRFWHLHGHLQEGRGWLERLLDAPGSSSEARAGGTLALAGLIYWQGDLERARALYEDALSLCRDLEDWAGVEEALSSLAILALFRTEWEEFDRLVSEIGALAEKVDQASSNAAFMAGLARLLRGDAAGAEPIFKEAIEAARQAGETWYVGQGLMLRARAELAQGRHSAAEETLGEALEISYEAGDLSSLAQAFDWLGSSAVGAGEPERGVRLAGAAQGLRERMGVGLTLPTRGIESPRDSARGQLSDEKVEAAWEEGSSWDLDEALAYARREDPPLSP